MSHPTFNLTLAAGLCVWLLTAPVVAQENLLERSREIPPQFLTASARDEGIQAISWRLLLNRDLDQRLQQRYDEQVRQMEMTETEVRKLAQRLPPELRFMDAAARSRLASRLSESLLDARLELAAQEKMLEMLQQPAPDAQPPAARRSASLVQAAEVNLKHAQEKLKASRKLADRGFVSEAQLLDDEQQVLLAEAELEHALYERTAEAQEPAVELARRIADLRLSIEPTKARMRAAESYLNSLTESASVIHEIELRQRQQAQWLEVLAQISGERERLHQEVDSLQSLQGRIEEAQKTAAGDQ